MDGKRELELPAGKTITRSIDRTLRLRDTAYWTLTGAGCSERGWMKEQCSEEHSQRPQLSSCDDDENASSASRWVVLDES